MKQKIEMVFIGNKFGTITINRVYMATISQNKKNHNKNILGYDASSIQQITI